MHIGLELRVQRGSVLSNSELLIRYVAGLLVGRGGISMSTDRECKMSNMNCLILESGVNKGDAGTGSIGLRRGPRET